MLEEKVQEGGCVARCVGLVLLCAVSCSGPSEPAAAISLPPGRWAPPRSSTTTARAIEEPSHPFEVGRPSADEIARARVVQPCSLANGDKRLDGLLVRVRGTYTVIEGPRLLAEGCQRVVFLEFDDGRIERLTPEGHRQLLAAATTGDVLLDVVLVGMVQTEESSAGRYGELTVYAIKSVAPQRAK
jgi:hypothetical protein